MAATQPSCSLMLVVEAGERTGLQLEAAFGAGSIASVCVFPPEAGGYDVRALQPLIGIIQKAGAAALLVDDARLARTLKADGLHLSAGSAQANYQEARDIVGRGCIVGADAGRSRDAAMHLGEDGADYIGFGVPPFVADKRTAHERQLELVQWWAEIFEVPCVAFNVDDAEDAQMLARAGADFVALHLGQSLTRTEAGTKTAQMLGALKLEGA